LPLSANFANSNVLGRKLKLACTSCTWTLTVALFGGGVIVIALATLLLGDLVVTAWHGGWFARIVSVLAFFTVPFVIATSVIDFRDAQNVDSLQKRLTWLGASFAVAGLLELVLALGELLLLAALGVIYIF
jgi:prepilin signal peptidase PulO-like enzyme (type II secretory pathway)